MKKIIKNYTNILQNYQLLKVEGHLRTCAGGNFKIFLFLQMCTESKFLGRRYEERFQKLYNTKLNRL